MIVYIFEGTTLFLCVDCILVRRCCSTETYAFTTFIYAGDQSVKDEILSKCIYDKGRWGMTYWEKLYHGRKIFWSNKMADVIETKTILANVRWCLPVADFIWRTASIVRLTFFPQIPKLSSVHVCRCKSSSWVRAWEGLLVLTDVCCWPTFQPP